MTVKVAAKKTPVTRKTRAVKAPKPGPKRLVAYRRLSTTKERQANSFDVQQKYIEEWGRRRKGQFEIVWMDGLADEKSGGTLDRAGMARVLDMVRSGEVDGLVAYNLSRVSRSMGDCHQLLQEFKSLGAEMWLADIDCDLAGDSTTATIQAATLSMVAQFERDAPARRNRDTARTLQDAGRPSGHPLYGTAVQAEPLTAEQLAAGVRPRKTLIRGEKWAQVEGLWRDISSWSKPADFASYQTLAKRHGFPSEMQVRKTALALLNGRYACLGLVPPDTLDGMMYVQIRVTAGQMFIGEDGRAVMTAHQAPETLTGRREAMRQAVRAMGGVSA